MSAPDAAGSVESAGRSEHGGAGLNSDVAAAPTPEECPPDGSPAAGTGRVLIVEPEPMVARILADKLRREGHEVTCSTTHSLAPAQIQACDVVLIDVDDLASQHPCASGSQPRAGWFAVVDGRHPESGVQAMRQGAAGVVVKPFKPTVVAAQVRALLDLRGRT